MHQNASAPELDMLFYLASTSMGLAGIDHEKAAPMRKDNR